MKGKSTGGGSRNESVYSQFLRHRILDNPIAVEKTLDALIQKLLREKYYVVFQVGGDGDFNHLISSVIHRCMRTIRLDNIALVWAISYLAEEYRDNEEAFQEYYNEIEICEEVAGTRFKAAYLKVLY